MDTIQVICNERNWTCGLCRNVIVDCQQCHFGHGCCYRCLTEHIRYATQNTGLPKCPVCTRSIARLTLNLLAGDVCGIIDTILNFITDIILLIAIRVVRVTDLLLLVVLFFILILLFFILRIVFIVVVVGVACWVVLRW